jgi:hypothetical protein
MRTARNARTLTAFKGGAVEQLSRDGLAGRVLQANRVRPEDLTFENLTSEYLCQPRRLVQLGGLEPPTSGSTIRRSNQLSYNCIL